MDFPDTINQDGFQLDASKPGRKQAYAAQRQAEPKATRKRYAYQIDRISEGTFATILLGSSTINTNKMQDAINRRAAQGYRLVFQVIEKKRTLIFWKRESLILSYEREL